MVNRAAGPTPDGRPRFGFVAGKAVGGAVERNRAKRLLRDAARGCAPAVAPGWVEANVRGIASQTPLIFQAAQQPPQRGGASPRLACFASVSESGLRYPRSAR